MDAAVYRVSGAGASQAGFAVKPLPADRRGYRRETVLRGTACGDRRYLLTHLSRNRFVWLGSAMFPDGVRSLIELRRAQHVELSANATA